MRIQVNGEMKDVPDGINMKALLKHLALPEKRIAVELNHRVIRKTDWETTDLEIDDRVEVIHFVGGG